MADIYIANEYWFAAFQLTFAMFGMGATLTVSDFSDVLKQPKSVSFGTLVQLLVVPLSAFLFIWCFGVAGGVAIGIALLAAIPGGTTSNIFTYMAKGSSPLSISITAITTLACLITTPLILSALISDYLPADFSMPTQQIVSDIALTLLLPLIVGMLVLRFLPNQAQIISKWSIRASLFGIFLIILGSSLAGRIDTQAFGSNNMLLILGFTVLMVIIGYILPKTLSLLKGDIVAIQMEVLVRNVNLGVLIKASMFPVIAEGDNSIGDMVLFSVLLYGAIQMIFAGLIIFYQRKLA